MTDKNSKLIADARAGRGTISVEVLRDMVATLCDALEAEAEARRELEKHEWNRRSGYEEMCAKFAQSLNRCAAKAAELEERNRRLAEALEKIADSGHGTVGGYEGDVAREALREGGGGHRAGE